MKNISIFILYFFLISIDIDSQDIKNNNSLYIYETPTKIFGKNYLNFISINNNRLYIYKFTIKYNSKKILNINKRKESIKLNYKLIDSNVVLEDGIVGYDSKNFILLKRKNMPYYFNLLDTQFSELTNEEKFNVIMNYK